MTGRVVLDVEGLRVRRGGAAVLSVERLALFENEVLTLVGPNGAGKTTLLLAVMGLVRPEAGRVLLDGSDEKGAGGRVKFRRRFAMVFQEPLLFSGSVRRNAGMGLSMRGVGRAEREERVMKSLRLFGVDGLAGRDARTLSGGEAQRVSLARAFAVAPRVLLLDEPFSSLDGPTRARLAADLKAVLASTGTAAVMATHDRDEALGLSDRVAVMREGSVVQCGSPPEVAGRPADAFVASFMGDATVLEGPVTGIHDGSFVVTVGGAGVEIAGKAVTGERVTFSIHPENVMLSRGPLEDVSARNSFPCTVTRVAPAGLHFRVHLDCGFPLAAALTRHSLESLGITEGARLLAAFKSTSVHVISFGAPKR